MTKTIPNSCPCCHQKLVITELHCEQCETRLTGSYVSLFHQFSEDEQLFIENFILNDGSLKSLAEQMNINYPTVRKMLDQIISKIK
jgi:hypothetical protein